MDSFYHPNNSLKCHALFLCYFADLEQKHKEVGNFLIRDEQTQVPGVYSRPCVSKALDLLMHLVYFPCPQQRRS